MKISDIQSMDGFTCLQADFTDKEIAAGYTSDLLSDVMANALEGSILITIQAHKNTVAVSALVGIAAILVCNDRPVAGDMLDAAKREGIAIFSTAGNQFETSVLLAQCMNNRP